MREYFGLTICGAGKVTAQVGPVFVWQRGMVDSVARNGAGDYTVTLGQGGIDSTEVLPDLQINAAVAASGLTAMGYVDSSDTGKRITTAQEAAMGGASTLTDLNFFATFYKIQP